MLAVILAALRYESRAAPSSPARSSRCARTASSRWLWAIRSSPSSVPSKARPARGPLTIAIATARFKVTTGPGEIRSNTSYRSQDLRPIRLAGAASLVMQRGDRRLHLIGTDRHVAQRAGENRDAVRDLVGSPEISVLRVERNDGAVGGRASGAAGISEQHQGEQPGDLALLRQQVVEHPREADRLGREVGPVQLGPRAGGVPLIEDEIQHLQHDAKPVASVWRHGHLELSTGRPDAFLRTADPLSHGRLWHEKRPGDLGGGEAAHRAKCQGQLRRNRERRMAAEEQKGKGVVLFESVAPAGQLEGGGGFLPAVPCALAPPLVGQAPGCDGCEP